MGRINRTFVECRLVKNSKKPKQPGDKTVEKTMVPMTKAGESKGLV